MSSKKAKSCFQMASLITHLIWPLPSYILPPNVGRNKGREAGHSQPALHSESAASSFPVPGSPADLGTSLVLGRA